MNSTYRLPVPLRVAYTIYAGLAFLPVALGVLACVLLLPTLRLRRSAARFAARGWLVVVGLRLAVRHPARLPAGQCVVVANHASYLDGLVLTAVLPPRFGFVIKREMSAVPLASFLLARIGSEFVERFDRHKGASDARRVLRNATNGHSLVFFPEGTFAKRPGLLKFHSGAFHTAARAGCPVMPCVIRGSRTALPAPSLLLSPGLIDVEFLPALPAAAAGDEQSTAALRDRARREILAALGEPDLSQAA
ncbi:MAG: Bifunctional protein Aas [Steroidobacteraceae bacterium]|nr:Bifunctional protein Aas [Steroidobacteraceae bacterium]